MLPLGTRIPIFTLPDVVAGGVVKTPDVVAGKKGALVMFLCNHCPFVKHVLKEIGRVGNEALSRGLGVAAINSNDVAAHPDDSPEKMKELATREGWKFPYLFDETQRVAKDFRAACTPDFFLFDFTGALVYRGQLDDARPGNDAPITGRDLREAIGALIAKRPIAAEQRASIGCNIKWKPGNEPDYFG
jgi:hypothetical protein